MAAPTKPTAEMPTFSYAQAAKGLGSSTASTNTEKASRPATPPSDRPNDEGNTSAPAQSSEPASSNGIMDNAGKSKAEIGQDSIKPAASGACSPSVTAASIDTMPKDDDMSLTPNGSSDSTWDGQSQASVPAEKTTGTPQDVKEKSSQNESEKKLPVKELREAPAPTVNVWQQRLEAQEAKARANAGLKSTGVPAKSAPKNATENSGSSEILKSSGRRKSSESIGEKKKTGDATKKGTTRSYPESDTTEALPPVVDAASWPTPQLAKGDGNRKPQKNEKAERVEGDKPARTKEKWMPVPYVPTAVFATPIPLTARKGGRAARGSREGGSNYGHGHTAGGDKHDATVGASKHTYPPNDRKSGVDPKQNQGAKTNDVEAPNDKKTSHQDEGRDNKSKNAESYAPGKSRDINNEPSSHHRQEYKAVDKTSESTAANSNTRSSGAPNEVHPRYSQKSDSRYESGSRSADPLKDASTFTRDFGRDRDYQSRDREYSREHRGEPRSERGRGTYRGRGGHSNYTNAQNTAYHTAPLPQHPFQPPKGYAFNSERHRMQSVPQNGTRSNNGMGIRSPSMPTPALYGPPLYPIQTDFAPVYGYPQIPPGPMTAVQYQPYMEQYSMMGMITMQLEYYFSVDNLCKDLFLRKHMDSQGFVLLSVIAAFKRIKTLTEDMDLLRSVCRQLRNVEFRTGEDGLDRIRKREKWEQWVLSMESRDPSARNEGPAPIAAIPSPNYDGSFENGIAFQQDGYSNFTNGSHAAYPFHQPTSTNAHHASGAPKSQGPARSGKLSSTAAEFSPLAPQDAQGENVGVKEPEATFPDEKIGNLVIVVRKPGIPRPAHSPLLGSPSRSFSNGNVDRYHAVRGQLSTETRPSSIHRKSPSSSEAIDLSLRRDSLPKISSMNKLSEAVGNVPKYYIKDKDAAFESLPESLDSKSYAVFREQALDQRLSNASGETPADMNALYDFWSHFLVRHFNPRMYNEFRSLAFDDVSSRNCTAGLQHLFNFYDSVLLSSEVVADRFAHDILELVKSELGKPEHPALSRLRATWRNGAFNLRSRKKIDDLIDKNLRAQLDS